MWGRDINGRDIYDIGYIERQPFPRWRVFVAWSREDYRHTRHGIHRWAFTLAGAQRLSRRARQLPNNVDDVAREATK